MEQNENIVLDGTENMETTIEETEEQELLDAAEPEEEKIYSQRDFDEGVEREVNHRVNQIVGKRLARQEEKLRKEFQKDRGLVEVIKAGTGEEDVEKVTGQFRRFYEGKGIEIPEQQQYSQKDIERLAAADAKEIIDVGMDEVKEELERLSSMGYDRMSFREKQLYKQLDSYYKKESSVIELEKIGVPKEVYESKDFEEFASRFKEGTPMTKIYQLYEKTQDKPPVEKMGPLKNENPGDDDVFTPEQVDKLTKKDYQNPKIMAKVRRSMLTW